MYKRWRNFCTPTKSDIDLCKRGNNFFTQTRSDIDLCKRGNNFWTQTEWQGLFDAEHWGRTVTVSQSDCFQMATNRCFPITHYISLDPLYHYLLLLYTYRDLFIIMSCHESFQSSHSLLYISIVFTLTIITSMLGLVLRWVGVQLLRQNLHITYQAAYGVHAVIKQTIQQWPL